MTDGKPKRARRAAEQMLVELKQRLREISDLNAAGSVLNWDQATYMPQAGAGARGRQLAMLGSLAHERAVAPALGRLLDSLVGYGASLPYDSDDSSLIRVAHREYQKKIKVPPDHIARAIAQGSASYDAWTRARPANDFATMVPYLERTLDLSREYSSYFAPYKHVADPHIDDADKGITTTCATLVSCMKRLLRLSAKTLSPRARKQKMPRFDPLGCDPSSRPQRPETQKRPAAVSLSDCSRISAIPIMKANPHRRCYERRC